MLYYETAETATDTTVADHSPVVITDVTLAEYKLLAAVRELGRASSLAETARTILVEARERAEDADWDKADAEYAYGDALGAVMHTAI
jgi:hypothetical protein